MKRGLVAALAFVLVAGTTLALITATALYRRDQATRAGVGASSGGGKSFLKQEDALPAEWLEEFTLTERSGEPFRSEDMRGKVWVVSFFFTSCPASCKEQNAHVFQLHKKWGPRGVTFVSITCDPDTDDPATLRQYADSFQADPEDWLFLTGSLNHIRRIGAEVFRLHVDKGQHVDRFTLVDQEGNVRGYFNWHDPLERLELEAALAELLGDPDSSGDGSSADRATQETAGSDQDQATASPVQRG